LQQQNTHGKIFSTEDSKMKKALGVFLLVFPILLILLALVMGLGIVDGLFAFLMSMLLTAIIVLCTVKGIDFLNDE
jgi:hypothetical protein